MFTENDEMFSKDICSIQFIEKIRFGTSLLVKHLNLLLLILKMNEGLDKNLMRY